MKYIFASKAKCLQYEIALRHHVDKGANVVLNEKEVEFCPRLSEAETLEEKAALLEGTIFNSAADKINYINS